MELDVYFLLGNALIKYKGGVILVSHDERLLKMVCQELWVCSRVRRIIMVSKRKRGERGGGGRRGGFCRKEGGWWDYPPALSTSRGRLRNFSRKRFTSYFHIFYSIGYHEKLQSYPKL